MATAGMQYFEGLAITLQITVIALIMGVILGVLVAVVRTAHDQQRPGRRNFSWGCSTSSASCIPPSSAAPP